MKINEYNVIGSAVRLDEIPPEYRKLPFLGRGATTLAFEKDPHTVLLFLRDKMKLEWLQQGLKMVLNKKIITPVRTHHIKGMSMMPLYMVEMPKLYKLDPNNITIVTRDVRNFTKIVRENNLYGPSLMRNIDSLIEIYQKEYPNSKILPFLKWARGYDFKKFLMDMGTRQFKQTIGGDIVLLDPIIDTQLYNKLLYKK